MRIAIVKILVIFIGLAILAGCGENTQKSSIPLSTQHAGNLESEGTSTDMVKADVLSVQISGQEDAYHFAVQVLSPDLGCQQYADWWEVVDDKGNLIYRRVLAHSHVNEQPFVRSGGPVKIQEDALVWVRAHMHPGGYGGMAYYGSAQIGFSQTELRGDFAAELEVAEPLPTDCDF